MQHASSLSSPRAILEIELAQVIVELLSVHHAHCALLLSRERARLFSILAVKPRHRDLEGPVWLLSRELFRETHAIHGSKACLRRHHPVGQRDGLRVEGTNLQLRSGDDGGKVQAPRAAAPSSVQII